MFWVMGVSFIAVYGLFAGLVRFSSVVIGSREGGNK